MSGRGETMTKSSLALATLLAFLGSGCADNEESLIVLNAPAWMGGDCVIPGDASAESLPYGVLDLSFGTPYAMPAILLNNTTSGAKANNSGVVTNELQLLDADVDLSMAQAPEIIDDIRDSDKALVSFNVPLPTNSLAPGQTQGVLVEVIPQMTAIALGDAIRAAFGQNAKLTVEAHVLFHASRSGNTVGKVGQIDAREFSFPISVCFGCLLSCATCPGAECPVASSAWGGGVCGNAQDLLVYPAACDAPAE
jgi:hypothetical protein